MKAVLLVLLGFTLFWFFAAIFQTGRDLGQKEQGKKDIVLHKKLKKFENDKKKIKSDNKLTKGGE